MQNRSATEDATANFKSNGNGHQKSFIPTRAPDERGIEIITLRTLIEEWPRRRRGMPGGLCDGEKIFFTWLLDRSFHPRFKERDGVLVVSEQVCAEKHHVSTRTIWRWKWNLCNITGELWVSKVFRPNMAPGDRYHFTRFDPKREDVQHTRDGVYGGKKLRGQLSGGMGARNPGQRSLPLPGSKSVPVQKPVNGLVQTEGGLWVPQSSEVPDMSAESRQRCRLRADNSVGWEPTTMSAESRQQCRVTADNDVGWEPPTMSGVSRQQRPLPADTHDRHKRDSVKSIEPASIKGEGTPPGDGFEQWALSLKTYLPSGLRTLKAELYAKVRSSSDGERADWQRRLDAVDERLFGRKMNGATPQPKPKPKTVSQIERLPTAEELADGAAYAASIGKKNLVVTAEQVAALQISANHQRKEAV